MLAEIESASSFLSNLLRLNVSSVTPVPSPAQLELFRVTMIDTLSCHYHHHWFPDKPFKGSGYRCLRINHKMDPVIAKAGSTMGLEEKTLKSLFPNELTMWVDPNEVSYRIGENGSICVLYEDSSSSSSPASGTGSGAVSNTARTTPSPNSTGSSTGSSLSGSSGSGSSSTSPLSSPSSSPHWYNNNYSSSPPNMTMSSLSHLGHKGVVKNEKTNQMFIMSNPTSLSFNNGSSSALKSMSAKSPTQSNMNVNTQHHLASKTNTSASHKHNNHNNNSSSNLNVIELISDYNSVVI
jgi:protein Tob/BTG